MNTSFQRCSQPSDEWYTPKWITDALGHFDLDPCAAQNRFWDIADCNYTKQDDGLRLPWFGRVFCNPPYSRALVAPFISRLAKHGNGIALIFNRMDIALWHDVIFPTADAMLVIRGRLRFIRCDGSQGDAAGCGSVLVAWGKDNAQSLINSNINGRYINLSFNSPTT